jgi:CPA2 family monovalent cation:H+ antiporter-2
MAVTPFLFYLAKPLTRSLLKLPLPEVLVNGLFPLKEADIPAVKSHLVIIGKDASALKLSLMARYNDLEHVSILFDPALAREKMNNGDMVVYGDAVNEPILRKAHVETADIVVISVGSIIPSMVIIEKVRRLNKNAYILVRSTLIRHVDAIEHPVPDTVFRKNDIAYFMGNPEQINFASELLQRKNQ